MFPMLCGYIWVGQMVGSAALIMHEDLNTSLHHREMGTAIMHAQPCDKALVQKAVICNLLDIPNQRPCKFWTVHLIPPCAAHMVMDE